MKIFERNFDNPFNEDGTEKKANLLGDFEIIETLFEDAYSSQRIGTQDGKVFLISETEVSGRYSKDGGSRFEVKELKSLKAVANGS